MTRLSAHGARSPLYTRSLTEEDRITFRKWARAWYIGCSAAIVVLFAIGFVTYRGQDVQTARRSQPVGFNALPTEGSHPFG
jgi:hypothetical protein